MKVNEKKKVFISYCWTNPLHEKWVEDLAKRLCTNGVDVVFDKWDLKPGEDKFSFMERMVKDESIDKVLIICDKGYKEKADSRDGGVGTETQIITPELYGKVEQRKFIPIIAEQGESFSEYVPIYIKSRIGIDMSSINSYEDGYELLLRDIFDKPLHVKPKIGTPPSFILNNASRISPQLYLKNQEIKRFILNNNTSAIIPTIEDFSSILKVDLKKFIVNSIEELEEPYYNGIIDLIDEMKPLRDEYLILMKNLISYVDESIVSDYIIESFESLYEFKEYQGNKGAWNDIILEHFHFFIYELFIWVIMLCFKYKKYNIIKKLTTENYIVNVKNSESNKSFLNFYKYLNCFDYKNKHEKLNRICLQADVLLERATLDGTNYKENLIDTDLFLYYISKLNTAITSSWNWFPITYIYKNNRTIKLLAKLESNDLFEKVKVIFNVVSQENFIEIINEKFDTSDSGFNNCFDCTIPNIKKYINLETIATK